MRVCDLVIKRIEKDADLPPPNSDPESKEYREWKADNDSARFVRGYVDR